MIWTKVAIDEAGIPAYLDPDELWNGFVMPYFRKEDVSLIQNMLDAVSGDEIIKYDADEDAFVVHSTYEEGYDEWFYGTDIDGMHLYPIGAGSWVWLESE